MDAELKALSKNITLILDSITKDYDKRVRPNYGKVDQGAGWTRVSKEGTWRETEGSPFVTF